MHSNRYTAKFICSCLLFWTFFITEIKRGFKAGKQLGIQGKLVVFEKLYHFNKMFCISLTFSFFFAKSDSGSQILAKDVVLGGVVKQLEHWFSHLEALTDSWIFFSVVPSSANSELVFLQPIGILNLVIFHVPYLFTYKAHLVIRHTLNFRRRL